MFLAGAQTTFLYGVQGPGSHTHLCHRNAHIRIMALCMCMHVCEGWGRRRDKVCEEGKGRGGIHTQRHTHAHSNIDIPGSW